MKPHMKKELTERDIKDLMTPRERPVPPADLAARIKQEIPADLPMLSSLTEDTKDSSTVGMSSARIWLMAASVIIAVGGGFLAFRLMEQIPAPGEAHGVVSSADAAVAEQEIAQTRGSDDYAEPTSEIEAAEVPIAEVQAIEAPVDTPAETTAEAETQRFAGERQSITPSAAPAQETTSNSRRLGDEGAAISDLDGVLVEQQILFPPPPPPPPPLAAAEPAPSSATESRIFANGVPSSDIPKPRAVAPPSRPASPGRGASVQPVGRSREQKKASSRDEELRVRADAGAAAGNARITSEYAGISGMEKEGRELEAQLKALEQVAASPSTGGTAEPNGAPYGDVFFESAGTNPFIDTEDDALSTFGLDVDTGSYTVARRYLRDGHLPPHESVRVEEFINYFDYGDASPKKEEFNLHAEGAPSIYGKGERYYLLRFNLSGRELNRAERRPALLTFVIDVSGSMKRENRLGLVKQALALLIDQLRADDRLALVVYGSRGEVVLEPTSNHGAIRRAIERLQTGGSTNAEEGLELAYELAARHRRRGAINRVILCSDGVANVGATSAGSILDRIRREANQGIELTTVGFGMGNYNDVLMEQLADTGNGRYAYVDTLDEARRIFVENLTGTLQTLAAEARAQVEFSPEIVSRYRLLGYENRDIADQRFRDDTVDAGEIGVGHKVTALYEIKTDRELRGGDRVATLRLRYGSVDSGKMVEVERAVTGADFVQRWESASSALKLTSLVAEYAEILKHSYWAREGDLDDVFRRAQRLSAEWEGDREVADFISLVGRAAEYQQRKEPGR